MAELTMRIAINAISANENIRGPDRYTTELLKSLAHVDHTNSYFVFYAPWQKWYADAIKAPNVYPVLLNPPRSRSLRILWQAFIFPRILKKYQPDILHLPNTIYIRKGHNYRVVVTIHDLAEFLFPEKFNKIRAYLRRFIARGAVRIADRIVAVSHYTKHEITCILRVNSDKIKVIWEGSPIINYREIDCESVRKKYKLESNYLLYVGQIEKTKNIEGVIRAYVLCRPKLRERCDLILIGTAGNAYRDVLKLIENNSLQENVRYLGYVEEEELPCFYKGAIALTFPSRVEGFGLVILEAMAYGAPVIASNAGALPEVAGDAAILVDPYDDEILAEAMLRVVSDKSLRSDLVSEGKKRIQEFSWTKAAKEMLNVYNEVHQLNSK